MKITEIKEFSRFVERPSLLSANSGYENYRGFLNLLYVFVGLGSFRLVIENILQYGLLIEFDWPIRFLQDPTHWPSAFLIVLVNVFILIEFYLEKLLSRRGANEKRYVFYQWLNLLSMLVFPALYIGYRKMNPLGSFLAVSIYSIVCLKLFSYLHVNYQCRRITQNDENKSLLIYPANLTLKNLFYFICAPTLCYELNFARSTKIRKVFLLRRIGEILVLLSLQFCLGQQWILPILRTLDRPLSDYSLLENLERILRLALPNHLLWLSFFYVYFHSTLNLLAEFFYFADRLFYRDWWNATDLYEFWNRWNIIVHLFCKRHIYKPLVIQYGFSPSVASLVVFGISAFFHEVREEKTGSKRDFLFFSF